MCVFIILYCAHLLLPHRQHRDGYPLPGTTLNPSPYPGTTLQPPLYHPKPPLPRYHPITPLPTPYNPLQSPPTPTPTPPTSTPSQRLRTRAVRSRADVSGPSVRRLLADYRPGISRGFRLRYRVFRYG